MMDSTLSRGYACLGRVECSGEARFRTSNHLSPPTDKYNKIYLSLVLSGVGFLLPYNRYKQSQYLQLLELANQQRSE